MMAFDSRPAPEPRALADDTLALLRDAVVTAWHAPEAPEAAEIAEAGLQAALARLVDESRTRALRAEEVLVAFKGLLASIPELNATTRRLEAVRLRERLITLCIRAYYAE